MMRALCGLLVTLLLAGGVRGDIASDLVLHVPLDGSLEDVSDEAQTVAISGGSADYGAGVVGSGSLDVGANTRYAVVDDHATLSLGDGDADGTAAGWLKTSVTGTNQAWLSQYDADNNDVDWYVNTSDQMQLWFRGSTSANVNPGAALAGLTDGAWHHVAVTWTHDSGTSWNVAVYIDGAVRHAQTIAWAPTADAADLCVGARPGGSLPWGGEIDDVRLYNGRALTGSEVADLFALGPGERIDAGRLVHLALDETSGTTAADSGPIGNDGASLVDFASMTTAGIGGSLGAQADLDNSLPCRIVAPLSVYAYPFSVSWRQHKDGGGMAVSCNGGNDKLWGVYQTGDTTVTVARRNTTYYGTSLSSLPDLSEPRLVTVVYLSETAFNCYVDGSLESSQTGLNAVPIAGGVTDLIVGVDRPSSYGNASAHFDGRIDDVRVYGRALTAADVAALFALGESTAKPWLYAPVNQISRDGASRGHFPRLIREARESCYALAP